MTTTDPRVRDAFDTVTKCVKLYGVVGAITLATVAVTAVAGGAANPFMWIRAVILLAIAPVLYRMAGKAAEGERRSLDRLRTLTLVLPIAIIGVDLIPGVCPPWYAIMQAISAVALVGVAVITRRAPLR